MISICYIIGQISPNLFKVDATTLKSATYRSSMMLNEILQILFFDLAFDLLRIFKFYSN
jgi:hypothetical protein